MIYVNSRPLNRFAPAAPQPDRFFQHTHTPEDGKAVLEMLSSSYALIKDGERDETVFTVPGRSEYVLRVAREEDEGGELEMRTRLGEDGKLGHWERTVREKMPLRRGLRARIGQRIPRLKPALMTYEDPRSLAEAFSKKTRAVNTHVRRRVYGDDTVQAAFSEYTLPDVEGGPVAVSTLTIRSENPETLRQLLATLGVSETSSESVQDVLLRAA